MSALRLEIHIFLFFHRVTLGACDPYGIGHNLKPLP